LQPETVSQMSILWWENSPLPTGNEESAEAFTSKTLPPMQETFWVPWENGTVIASQHLQYILRQEISKTPLPPPHSLCKEEVGSAGPTPCTGESEEVEDEGNLGKGEEIKEIEGVRAAEAKDEG
jgi:hypothetical protein